MHNQKVSLEDVGYVEGELLVYAYLFILCDLFHPSYICFFGSSVKIIVMWLVDRAIPKIIICFIIPGSRDIVLIFLISLFSSAVIYAC